MRKSIFILAAFFAILWLAWSHDWQSGAARKAPGEQSVFIIQMREQADLSQAYHIQDWEQRGRFVLNTLRAAADRSQPAVQQFLSGMRLDGHVDTYTPYYIVNWILVHGDAQAAQAAARLPGVAAVIPLPSGGPLPEIAVTYPTKDAFPTSPEWNIQRIGADQVWSLYGATGQGIVVANIDSGVEYDHPGLVSQYRGNLGGEVFDHNYNWWDPTGTYALPSPISGPYPLSSSHGTHTMGLIVGDDGSGNQVGVAPQAKWIAAYGFSGWAGFLSATQWMIAPWQVNDVDPSHPTADPAMRPHVVNNSWGAPGGLLLLNPLLEAQQAAGIFPTFAAGNSGSDCGTLVSPGDNPAAFNVGATDSSDAIAFFSSRGPESTQAWLGLYGIGPNLSAPGYNTRTTHPGGTYVLSGGTSMASPHVAGTVALLWSAEPALVGRVAETAAILRGTALPRTASHTCGGVPGNQIPNNTFGWGRLDALAAVEWAWQAGVLAGQLSDASSGAPLVGADISLERLGHTVWTASGEDGRYAFPLGQGAYTVTVQAYGYAPWSQTGVVLTKGLTTTLDVTLAALPVYTLTGIAAEGSNLSAPFDQSIDEAGEPAWAQIGLADTPLLTESDPATGAYSLTVAQGSYSLHTLALGYLPHDLPLEMDSDQTLDLAFQPTNTYYIRDSRSPCGPTFNWIDATDGTPHSLYFQSYFALSVPGLPAFPYYRNAYSTYYISSNGLISFYQGYPRHTQDVPATVIPYEGPPNNAIYAFEDTFNPAGTSQGVIYHKVLQDRYLVIEFYQVQHWPSGKPETFEFILDTQTGVILLQYLEISQPDWATVGVENSTGSNAALYSYENSASLGAPLAVGFYPVFGPPPADQTSEGVFGTLSGTVTISGTQTPIPGAIITATSFLTSQVATTGPDGIYFMEVCADLYTLQAAATGYAPGSVQSTRLRWENDVRMVDLTLQPLPADPQLDISATPDAVAVGQFLTYTLTITNAGDGPLISALLSDTLPAEVTYITSTPPAAFQDGVLTWTVELPPGKSADFIVVVQVNPLALPGSTLTNQAVLRWEGTPIAAQAEVLVLSSPGIQVYLPMVARR